MRVLLAECDPDVAQNMAFALGGAGHKVVAVASPAEAAQVAKRWGGAVLIVGLAPPGSDSLAFAHSFRELVRGIPASAVAFAERERMPAEADLADSGIDDVLYMPLSERELNLRLAMAERLIDLQRTAGRHAQEMRDLREELETQNAQLTEAVAFMEMANHRFSELFAGLPIACFTYDAEGRIHEWNRASESLYGIAAADAFLRPISEVIVCRPGGAEGWCFAQNVFRGEVIEGSERAVELPGGRTCYVLYNVFPLRRPDGQIVGAICTGVDISQRKAAEAKVQEQMSRINDYSAELRIQKDRLEEANTRLEALAVTDCLTGVGNHRAFRESLEAEYQRAVRHSRPLSLLLVDVDRFKDYNDAFGHPAGDAALQAVARVLAEGARAGDSVARYGGEEFAVVLPDTDASRAMAVAERHRCAVAAYAFPGRQVTVSIGAATLSLSTPTREDLIAQADAALYAAKSAGRNCAAHGAATPVAADASRADLIPEDCCPLPPYRAVY